MSDTAIQVENLSKRYIISHQRAGGDGLRHVLRDNLSVPFRWLAKGGSGQKSEVRPPISNLRSPTSEEFHALKDVSFDLKRSGVVGLIGRDGARRRGFGALPIHCQLVNINP